MTTLKTEKLLKILLTVKRKAKPKYPPTRKSYNIHTYG